MKSNIKGDGIKITEEDIKDICNTYKNGDTSVFGSNTIKKFETNFKNQFNLNNFIALPNCTSAIFSALLTLNITKEDEIIVPNLTHPSVIYPVLLLKAKMKICDSPKKEYGFDIKHFTSLINKNTKCVIFSYLHGIPANIDKIKQICEENNIILIEDVAQGLGVQKNEIFSGNFGDFSCFSFGEGKTLVFGEAGGCSCINHKYLKKMKSIRHIGEVFKGTDISSIEEEVITYNQIIFKGFDYLDVGFNFRPFPPVFSLGINKLNNIKNNIKARIDKYKSYFNKLKDHKNISFLIKEKDIENSAPLGIPILLDNDYFERDKIILGLLRKGICVGKFFYPQIKHINSFSKKARNNDDAMENSNYISNNILIFPTYENISFENISFICKTFGEVLNEYMSNKNSELFNQEHSRVKLRYFDGFFMKY
jgi:dTDP-4-amino-4,6-dideoxygalactose transaminase